MAARSSKDNVVIGAILLYHRIASDTIDPFGLCVDPSEFAAQMKHLRNHYQPVPLDTFRREPDDDVFPDRAVAVTFDDGYVDNLTVASPTLLEYGIPATFFVTTEGLDDGRELWWDTICRLILCEPTVPSVIDLNVAGTRRQVSTSDDRCLALRAIHDAIRDLPFDERLKALAHVQEQLAQSETEPTCRPLRTTEILRLASLPGHAIGVHTTHHLMLPAQPRTVQRSEIRDCQNVLESLLRRKIEDLAYPFGGASEETVQTARDLGFTIGVGVDPAPIKRGADRMRLPRIDVRASTNRFRDLMANMFSPS